MEIMEEKQMDMVLIAPVLTKIDEAITRPGGKSRFSLAIGRNRVLALAGLFFIVVIEHGVR
jgi:hypothetical protein